MNKELLNKASILQQHGISIWLIGLSGAGKTTISLALEKKLVQQSYFSLIQDADSIRLGLNKGLGFSIEDRRENIRRAAEVSKILVENEIISINAFICPTEEMRQMLFSIIGRKKVFLVYLSTPLEVCELRDVKGMYKKARKGEIKSFTGLDSIFEKPAEANLIIDTSNKKVDECIDLIIKNIEDRIRYKK